MNLSHWFVETCNVAAFTGRSSSGDPTHASAAETKCRAERRTVRLTNAKGELVETDTVLYTPTALGLQDRVWLPGVSTANANAARNPVKVEEQRDRAGRVVMGVAFL